MEPNVHTQPSPQLSPKAISADTVLLISKTTDVKAAAGSVFQAITTQGIYVPMRAIGHPAVSQMVKVSAIAIPMLIARGINVLWRTSFDDVWSERQDKDITAIVMTPVRVS
jgi:stage V sporulation protein SpoVS